MQYFVNSIHVHIPSGKVWRWWKNTLLIFKELRCKPTHVLFCFYWGGGSKGGIYWERGEAGCSWWRTTVISTWSTLQAFYFKSALLTPAVCMPSSSKMRFIRQLSLWHTYHLYNYDHKTIITKQDALIMPGIGLQIIIPWSHCLKSPRL